MRAGKMDQELRHRLQRAEEDKAVLAGSLAQIVSESRLMRVELIKELRDALEQRESLRAQLESQRGDPPTSPRRREAGFAAARDGIERRMDKVSTLHAQLEETMAHAGPENEALLQEAAEERRVLMQLLVDAEREKASLVRAVAELSGNSEVGHQSRVEPSALSRSLAG